MSEEMDTEKWLAHLFSELIRRGLDSHEHIHNHGSPIGDFQPPSLEEIRDVHLGYVGEFLIPLLQKHLDDIIRDYRKLEEKP